MHQRAEDIGVLRGDQPVPVEVTRVIWPVRSLTDRTPYYRDIQSVDIPIVVKIQM